MNPKILIPVATIVGSFLFFRENLQVCVPLYFIGGFMLSRVSFTGRLL